MADDKVVNVKLVLAEIVQKHIVEKECLSEDPALLKLKEKLAQDADVRETFF